MKIIVPRLFPFPDGLLREAGDTGDGTSEGLMVRLHQTTVGASFFMRRLQLAGIGYAEFFADTAPGHSLHITCDIFKKGD